jgi:ammonia channel protein AmtB
MVTKGLSAAGVVAITAAAGWYIPVGVALIVTAITLIVIWVLADEQRTRRAVDIIKAIRDRATSGDH